MSELTSSMTAINIVPSLRVKTKQHFESCMEDMTFRIRPIQISLLERYLLKERVIGLDSFLPDTKTKKYHVLEEKKI